MTDHRNGYDLETELKPRIAKGVWPHVEQADLLTSVNNLAIGGHRPSYAGWFRKPDTPPSGIGKWARYFPNTTQGGAYDGTALVFVYGSGGRYYGRPEWQGEEPTAFRVAICDHEKVGSGTREQERRGYHPGCCAKCGLDMTVDSGD